VSFSHSSERQQGVQISYLGVADCSRPAPLRQRTLGRLCAIYVYYLLIYLLTCCRGAVKGCAKEQEEAGSESSEEDGRATANFGGWWRCGLGTADAQRQSSLNLPAATVSLLPDFCGVTPRPTAPMVTQNASRKSWVRGGTKITKLRGQNLHSVSTENMRVKLIKQ